MVRPQLDVQGTLVWGTIGALLLALLIVFGEGRDRDYLLGALIAGALLYKLYEPVYTDLTRRGRHRQRRSLGAWTWAALLGPIVLMVVLDGNVELSLAGSAGLLVLALWRMESARRAHES